MSGSIGIVRKGLYMKQITRRAYAKINLGLDVLGRRANGYHDVRMIMQTVGIYDELSMKQRADGEIRIEVLLSDGQTEELACDEHNLIYKAAALVMREYHLEHGVDVSLKKTIPIAAGMAGGSTDAAATILLMNSLYELGLSKEQMCRLGVTIGADVPYCMIGGTVLAEGIGEILTPLLPAPQCSLLVVKPTVGVSTAHVYTALDSKEKIPHPDLDGLITCIREQNVAGMAGKLGNVLETVTVSEYPIIAQLKEEMLSLGAVGALMSGSGPTVFGIFQNSGQLRAAFEKMQTLEGVSQIFMTNFVADIEAEKA